MKTKFNYYRLVMFCVSICLMFFTFSIFTTFFNDFDNVTNAASWTTQTEKPTKTDTNNFTIIENEKQLAYLVNNISASGKYKLVRNLDMSGYTFPGIGNKSSSTTTFSGTFDGQGFVISNITSEQSFANQGLFASVANATLKNISLSNCTFRGYTNVGAVAVYANNSTIEKIILTDCKVELIYQVAGLYPNIGGVVGYANGTTKIKNAFNNKGSGGYVKSSVSNTSCYDIYMGGIVGLTKANCSVEYCFNEVPVTNTGMNSSSHQLFAGGIVGWSYSPISLCGNTGAITVGTTTSNKTYAGGIAGCTQNTITDCYNRANITAYAKQYDIASESKLNATSAKELCSLESGFFAKKYTITGSSTVTKSGYRKYAFAGGISGWSDKATTRVYSIGTITGGGEYLKTVTTYKFEIKKYKKNIIAQWKYESDEGTESQSVTAQRCLPYTAPICGNVNNTNETTTYYSGTVQCYLNSTYMEEPWSRDHNYVKDSSSYYESNASYTLSLWWDGKLHSFLSQDYDMVYWVGISSSGTVSGGIGTKPDRYDPDKNITSLSYNEKETFSTSISVYDTKFSTTIKSTKSSSISTTNMGTNWKYDTTYTKNSGYPYISNMYW